MKHAQKISWMKSWARKNKCRLELNGECGFGRECVGIIANGLYPDYEWYDENYKRVDENGDMWIPADAYHKHPCVAVLGVGLVSESQLYDWLKWFDENGFVLEIGESENKNDVIVSAGKLFLHIYHARMVRKQKDDK